MGEAKEKEKNVLTMIFILFKYKKQYATAWFDKEEQKSKVVQFAGHCFDLLTDKTRIHDIVLLEGDKQWGTCNSTEQISNQDDLRLVLRVKVKPPQSMEEENESHGE